MADVFISYARKTLKRVRRVADGLIAEGRDVWWDNRLEVGSPFGLVIDKELDKAKRVLVAWSEPARGSTWVYGEATRAWEDGKLVQVMMERVRIPVPFNALHAVDMSNWKGEPDERSWIDLRRALDSEKGSSGDSRQLAPPTFVRPQPPGVAPIIGALVLATSLGSSALLIATRASIVRPAIFSTLAFLAFSVNVVLLALALVKSLRTDTRSRGPSGDE
jgi:TIR domain-containing protein